MSTVDRTTASEMSGKAYDLLDCFVSGLDKVVYEIAESLAKAAGQVNQAGVVEIQQKDVRAAAEMVFAAIRENKNIPRDALDDIEQMHQCMQAKCEVKSPEA
jgi:hypothetical protein